MSDLVLAEEAFKAIGYERNLTLATEIARGSAGDDTEAEEAENDNQPVHPNDGEWPARRRLMIGVFAERFSDDELRDLIRLAREELVLVKLFSHPFRRALMVAAIAPLGPRII